MTELKTLLEQQAKLRNEEAAHNQVEDSIHNTVLKGLSQNIHENPRLPDKKQFSLAEQVDNPERQQMDRRIREIFNYQKTVVPAIQNTSQPFGGKVKFVKDQSIGDFVSNPTKNLKWVKDQSFKDFFGGKYVGGVNNSKAIIKQAEQDKYEGSGVTGGASYNDGLTKGGYGGYHEDVNYPLKEVRAFLRQYKGSGARSFNKKDFDKFMSQHEVSSAGGARRTKQQRVDAGSRAAKSNPWLKHLSEVRELLQGKNLTNRQIIAKAKKSYKK